VNGREGYGFNNMAVNFQNPGAAVAGALERYLIQLAVARRQKMLDDITTQSHHRFVAFQLALAHPQVGKIIKPRLPSADVEDLNHPNICVDSVRVSDSYENMGSRGPGTFGGSGAIG
jgi:hypothetical protein